MLDVAEDGLHQDLAQAGPAVELMAQTLARVAQDVETDNTPQLIITMKKNTVCAPFLVPNLLPLNEAQHCTVAKMQPKSPSNKGEEVGSKLSEVA